MLRKKYNADEKNMTLKELLEEYAKDYYVSLEYKPNGQVDVFIGSLRRQEVEGSE